MKILSLWLCASLFLTIAINGQVNPPVKVNPANPNQQIPIAQLPKDGVRGMTVVKTIMPPIISDLCPNNKISGDNDFGRRTVYVTVNIYYRGYIGGNDSVLKAIIGLRGAERADGDPQPLSVVEGNWEIEIFRAPSGWVIDRLEPPYTVNFSFNADPRREGVQQVFDGCKGAFFKLSNGTFGFEFDPAILQELVVPTSFGGDDFTTVAGRCLPCGFRIKSLQFKPLTVRLRKL
jgi:hypothetical protein